MTPERAYFRGTGARLEAGAGWLVGFAPTVYLGLSGGGYDIIARSEVGVLLWWMVLLGAIVGVLPRARVTTAAWVAVALLGGFLAWTWIGTGWSASEERTLAETARVATYIGFLVVGLCVVSRFGARWLLYGLAGGVAVVALLAVLSRLQPSWFPADTAARLYATSRLRYPFDYSDGVGEFAALGLPLLLFVATGARTAAGRALGAAGLPVIALCLAMTVSRGGILAAVVGVVVFFALAPDRAPKLATLLTAVLGCAIVMGGLLLRPGVRDAFMAPAPAGDRHDLLAVLVLACFGVAAIQVGITLAARFGTRPRWLRMSVARTRIVFAALAVAVLALVLVGIASGADHRLWEQFKQPNPPTGGSQYSRLLSVAGSHRYQYWQAALNAFDAHPWKGLGPGTFEFYWSQHNTLKEFVRNAHSLWIETMAELGVIGLLLIAGFFAVVLGAGTWRALRSAERPRLFGAAAVAGVAAFCAAAAFDWVWQIGAVPLVALLLAAVALADVPARERIGREFRFLRSRAVLALGALVSLWAILIPLATTVEVRASQAASGRGDFRTALADASTAQSLDPDAASPRLQRALLLEQLGDVSGAEQAIAAAESREAPNWRIWLVASRIATEAGHPKLALEYYRRARALNPTSFIFAG